MSVYKQGQHITLKVHNESGHIEVKPTLTDYFKCILILFSIFTLIYIGIQFVQVIHRFYA